MIQFSSNSVNNLHTKCGKILAKPQNVDKIFVKNGQNLRIYSDGIDKTTKRGYNVKEMCHSSWTEDEAGVRNSTVRDFPFYPDFWQVPDLLVILTKWACFCLRLRKKQQNYSKK